MKTRGSITNAKRCSCKFLYRKFANLHFERAKILLLFEKRRVCEEEAGKAFSRFLNLKYFFKFISMMEIINNFLESPLPILLFFLSFHFFFHTNLSYVNS